ncbi:MAG: SDR family oxidoreductase [Hyphomicrobiales bacterium]
MRFKNKRILVTGSTRGIGRATAKAFAEEGAHVVVHGRAAEAAEIAAGEVGGVAGFGFDVSSAVGCESLVAASMKTLGGLDILVNNAGIWYSARTEDFDEDAYDRMMDANVKSVFFCTKASLPELRLNGGAIVNLASESGVMGQYGAVVYCATKAAILNMTRAMALEYAPDVRVNCVSPGTVDTDMVRLDAARADDPARRLAAMADYAPLRRMAKPEEVASGILYLASPDAAYVTGTSLSIDGGTTAGH